MSEVELASFSKSGFLTTNYEGNQDIGKWRRHSDLHRTFTQADHNFANVVQQGSLNLSSIGLVDVILLHDRLMWKSKQFPEEWDPLSCWRRAKVSCELPVSEIYAVEGLDNGSTQNTKGSSLFHRLLREAPMMHCFTVHSFRRSSRSRCQWIPKAYVFGHADLKICEAWVESIQVLLDNDKQRPKKLLIFVNPYGGKRAALGTCKRVIPLFDRSKVKTKVICTKRPGHAFDVLDKATEEDLNAQDGIVVVGGDGLFNEVLNGLLAHRHRVPIGPIPRDFVDCAAEVEEDQTHTQLESTAPANPVSHMEINESFPLQTDMQPLLDENNFKEKMSVGQVSNLYSLEFDASVDAGTFASFKDEPNQHKGSTTSSSPQLLRIGIIPAGSTDAVVVSTTGSRDPITSALHIILGDNMPLDVVRLISWKSSNLTNEKETPRVRYAASFAGYGFFGDIAKESELFRWMGLSRYDYVGAKVFLRHKKYAAKVCFLDVLNKSDANPSDANMLGQCSYHHGRNHSKDTNQLICRINCPVCARGRGGTPANGPERDNSDEQFSETTVHGESSQWRTLDGTFQSVGAAVMSCRNDKAPDGMVAHAHLSDGLLDLILIRDCSRPAYLRHLIELARKGDNHLNFNFVEHYKTPIFTFTSYGEESVWSADGELFPAHKLSAQVFRGLVHIFASGPEV